MDQSLWQETVREDTYLKSLELYYWLEGRIYVKKEKGISAIKRRSKEVCQRTIKKRVHQTLKIVKRLEENDLYMKLEKYKWKVREVGFLGIVIGLDRIKIEEEKVKEILGWPTLKCVKDMQKFLSLVNYYHWFIEGFALIARLLHDLVKKDQKWNWMER